MPSSHAASSAPAATTAENSDGDGDQPGRHPRAVHLDELSMSTTFREQSLFLVAVMILIASIVTVLDPPGRGDLVGAPLIGDAPTSESSDAGSPDDQASTPGTTGSPSPTATSTSAPGTENPTGGGGSETPTPDPTNSPSGSPPYEANLYSGAENTRGITDELIRFCGHAALTLAAAFDTSEADLSVYWEELSGKGGIYGRDVEISWEDDAYSADTAVTAVTACADKDPFMILGGIGFDQIPGARTWAETNKELYLHHIAVKADNPTYSFTLQPTVQQYGRAFGEYIASTYRGQSVAIVYRQSPNWAPGHQAGAEVLRANGINPTEVPVQQNQGAYTVAINQIRDHDVVWLWENALNGANFIQQAAAQGVRPKWILPPFQTTLDLIGNNRSLNPTIDGVATWPSYVPGGYGGAWSEHGLQAEIDAFEAAYAKHRPGTDTNDILFQVWVGNKVLHQLLLACGPDCTRNRFAGMLERGLQLRINPACTIDTTGLSMNGRLGGHEFTVQESFATGGGAGWKTNRWCARSLL